MSTEETRTVALPKLYGAPAYARPVVPVVATERPFDPDALPLIVAMTDDERWRLEQGGTSQPEAPLSTPPALTPRPFSLRELSDRIRGVRG